MTTPVPFYRLIVGSAHFFTANEAERKKLDADGVMDKGITCTIWSTPSPELVPLFRLVGPGGMWHCYTTSKTDLDAYVAKGYAQEGNAGFVYEKAGTNLLPLYELASPTEDDFVYTCSKIENDLFVSQGYVAKGIACYVAAPIVTPAQIAQVKSNLANLQQFIDYLEPKGNSRISTAYADFNEPQSNAASAVGSLLLGCAVSAMGFALPAGGGAALGFLTGLIKIWERSSGSGPSGGFGPFQAEFTDTCTKSHAKCADAAADVLGNWNLQFEIDGKPYRVSDLANTTFPAEIDITFDPAAAKALKAFDVQLWTAMMRKYCMIISGGNGLGIMVNGSQEKPPLATIAEQYGATPGAMFFTYVWTEQPGGGAAYWLIFPYQLNIRGYNPNNGINKDMYTHIFMDSTPGTVINASALFKRQDVFTTLVIPGSPKWPRT
jgi:hypothetical protein